MEDSLKEGKLRFNSRLDKLKRTQKELRTVHGKLIYKNTLKSLSTRIKALQERKTGVYAADWSLIQSLNTLLLTHLTLVTILDTISTSQKRTALASKIGQKVYDEINFAKLKVKFPVWWKKVEKQINKRVSYGYKRNYAVRAANAEFGKSWQENLSTTSKIHIGLALLESFRQTTGLIEYTRQRTGTRRWQYMVLPTKEAFNWIDRVNTKASLLSPFYLPLIDKPLDWINLDTGGYKFPAEVNWGLIKGRQRYDKSSDYNLLYKAANVLQRVPHRVNPWVTEVASNVFVKSVKEVEDLKDNYSKALLETNCTLEYRRCQAKYHGDRLKLLPERIKTDNTLSLARRFSNTDIYFPVQSDFRGRLYYAPRYLNPQGTDLAKGLLQFATPTSVKSCEHWFLIGGANSYGIKGSLEERQEWSLKHEKQIKRVANDPLGYPWWKEAASPYQFLAWCNEFAQWISDRIRFKTMLPVRLDHHASGLQIVACMEKDETLMRLTNVASVVYPNDIYNCILKQLTNRLKASYRPEDHQWLNMGVDRSLIKSLTVSLMYGGSYYGLEKILIDWYVQHPDDVFKRDVYFEAKKFIENYHEALNIVSPVPLKFLSDIRSQQGDQLLSFKSPSGFTVFNDYKKYSSCRIKTTINKEVIVARANIEKAEFNQRAARQALPANKVHTYDAALLHKVVTAHDWPLIQTLHDCYSIPPQDCDKVQQTIQKAINDIFGVDVQQQLLYVAS